MTSSNRSTVSPTVWAPAVTALIFVAALNLRPALTAVGPLLPQLGEDLGLSETQQGLLGSVPLLAFALISPLVYRPARRFGVERTVWASLLILAAGCIIRSWAGASGLWIGTIIIGIAIAVGNVLVPTVLKRDYAAKISPATAAYSAFLTIGAAIASAVAVPLSDGMGWQGALGIWALPALLVAAAWSLRMGRRDEVSPESTEASSTPSVWRQRSAWWVTAFMGLQSTMFYSIVTWLPTIETSTGLSDAAAGVHLFVYQVLGVIGGLIIPKLLGNPSNQVVAGIASGAPMVVGMLGLLIAPDWALAWVMLTGLGSGASLVVALTLISLRGRTQHETTQLSGMAQSVGYLLAAAGPPVAGFLAEETGNWDASLILLAGVAAALIFTSWPAGRLPKDRQLS